MSQPLFIFDIDGTLTKSETTHVDAFVDGMADLGIEVELTNPEKYPHVTDSAISKYHFEKVTGKRPNSIDMAMIEQRVMHHYQGKPVADQVEGAVDFLEEVFDRKIPYCIATGSFLSLAIEKLDKAKLPYDLSLLATAAEGDTREEILTSAISKAQKEFEFNGHATVISFGDGIWDLKTANNLNAHFVGIGHKIDYLQSKGAKHVFKNYQGISTSSVIELFL